MKNTLVRLMTAVALVALPAFAFAGDSCPCQSSCPCGSGCDCAKK